MPQCYISLLKKEYRLNQVSQCLQIHKYISVHKDKHQPLCIPNAFLKGMRFASLMHN